MSAVPTPAPQSEGNPAVPEMDFVHLCSGGPGCAAPLPQGEPLAGRPLSAAGKEPVLERFWQLCLPDLQHQNQCPACPQQPSLQTLLLVLLFLQRRAFPLPTPPLPHLHLTQNKLNPLLRDFLSPLLLSVVHVLTCAACFCPAAKRVSGRNDSITLDCWDLRGVWAPLICSSAP